MGFQGELISRKIDEVVAPRVQITFFWFREYLANLPIKPLKSNGYMNFPSTAPGCMKGDIKSYPELPGLSRNSPGY